MNYDVTLMRHASRPAQRPVLPDSNEPGHHIGASAPRLDWLRMVASDWLVRLAARIAPRPARTERDALFDAIAMHLAESAHDRASLDSTSHPGSACVLKTGSR